MSKSSKSKHNPKVTFDGSFEDLLGMTFNKSKFKIGDVVVKDNDNHKYIITGSKQTGIMPHGSDYAIQPEDNKLITIFVKETEIHFAQ